MLQDVSPLLRKIMDGQDLTAAETDSALRTIMKEDQDGYFYLAFLVALHTKGETAEELFGLCQLEDFVPKINTGISPEMITDLSGTGGAKLKTINVSTAASFIVAGAGFNVAKQAARGVTGPTGSADVFGAFGIDVYKITPETIKQTLGNVGIVPYFYVAFGKGMENRSRLGKRIFFDGKLGIRIPFHLAFFAYSPIEMRSRTYGVYDEKYLRILAELFQKLGYAKCLVFHGVGGLCEVSNIGPTKIVEFNGDAMKEYTINPEDMGLKKSSYEDIRSGSAEQNIIDFLRILYGKEIGPKRDLVLANAAASFYALGKVTSLKEGVELARQVLEEGKAAVKLEELTNLIGEPAKLKDWKAKAGPD